MCAKTTRKTASGIVSERQESGSEVRTRKGQRPSLLMYPTTWEGLAIVAFSAPPLTNPKGIKTKKKWSLFINDTNYSTENPKLSKDKSLLFINKSKS